MICTTLVLGLHLATYHFERGVGKEDFNPGVYARCDDWSAGIYANSDATKGSYYDTERGQRCWNCAAKPKLIHVERDRRVSAWAAYNYDVNIYTFSLGVAVGYRNKPVALIGGVSRRFGDVRITLIPSKSGGVHASYEF
jgi:hypothetical protein